jgi:hypothetical protein
LSIPKGGNKMSNFESRVNQPWTTYDNRLIQEETVFKNASQKLCYLYLVSYANAKKIFPSMDTIANAICTSKRNAIRIIEQLEEMNFIEVVRSSGKANNYILNDYFEVIATSDKMSPVTKCHGSSDKMSPVPVTKCHPITTNKKELTKKKNSSSSENRNQIDLELKEKYSDKPFEEIKINLLNDSNAITKTDNQYKKMLEYRLKNWMPKKEQPKKPRSKKPIRKELLPEWYENETKPKLKEEPNLTPEEVKKKKEELEQRLKKYKKA